MFLWPDALPDANPFSHLLWHAGIRCTYSNRGTHWETTADLAVIFNPPGIFDWSRVKHDHHRRASTQSAISCVFCIFRRWPHFTQGRQRFHRLVLCPEPDGTDNRLKCNTMTVWLHIWEGRMQSLLLCLLLVLFLAVAEFLLLWIFVVPSLFFFFLVDFYIPVLLPFCIFCLPLLLPFFCYLFSVLASVFSLHPFILFISLSSFFLSSLSSFWFFKHCFFFFFFFSTEDFTSHISITVFDILIYSCKASGETMFNVFPCGAKMKRFLPLTTVEQPTSSWPWEKHGLCRLRPTSLSECSCALLMLMVKLRRTRNWSLLNWNGKTEGMIGMCGMKTSCPAAWPVMVVASMTWGISFLKAKRVPL